MSVEFYQGDSNEVLSRMIANGRRVHSVITDPPYYLESVVKRFGKDGSAAAKAGSDGRFTRQSRGFMGRKWDGASEGGYRIAQDPEFWRKCYDLLLPGGFCLAFSSPRTGHWQAVAMEQAGFIMHPFIGWAYGSGFPKAHAVTDLKRVVTAEDYAGWYYGTQTLKPALEPIYVGQKPFSEKTGYANVLKHGVGGFNIEECRVPTLDDLNGGAYAKGGSARTDEWGASNGFRRDKGLEYVQPVGRWPANLIHDGSPEVAAWFPETKGQKGKLKLGAGEKTKGVYNTMQREADSATATPRGDVGSAARFFNAFPFEDHLIFYYPKPGKAEKKGTTHPTVKPEGLLRHLARLVTPRCGYVLDPFAGSGSTGKAAIAEGMLPILIEQEPDHADEIRARFDLPMVNAALATQYLAAIESTKAGHRTMELI